MPVLTFPQSKSNFVEITLTQGKTCKISPEDYARVSKYKWQASNIKGRWYATRGARKPDGRQSIQYLHRFIMGAQVGQDIDHASGDSLDATRGNLRVASKSQNMQNRRKQVNNSSGFTGVYASGSSGRFFASVRCQGTTYYAGTHDTAEQAARARDQKAIDLFGPFARLNFSESCVPLPAAA